MTFTIKEIPDDDYVVLETINNLNISISLLSKDYKINEKIYLYFVKYKNSGDFTYNCLLCKKLNKKIITINDYNSGYCKINNIDAHLDYLFLSNVMDKIMQTIPIEYFLNNSEKFETFILNLRKLFNKTNSHRFNISYMNSEITPIYNMIKAKTKENTFKTLKYKNNIFY